MRVDIQLHKISQYSLFLLRRVQYASPYLSVSLSMSSCYHIYYLMILGYQCFIEAPKAGSQERLCLAAALLIQPSTTCHSFQLHTASSSSKTACLATSLFWNPKRGRLCYTALCNCQGLHQGLLLSLRFAEHPVRPLKAWLFILEHAYFVATETPYSTMTSSFK